MPVTNKLGLPEPFVQAATKDYTYKPKRYSVTTLLNSEREIMLKRRHNDELTIDVSDMIWAIFGTAVHGVLENSNKAEHLLTEQYLSIPITLNDGDIYTLSGVCDLFNTKEGEVIDYKVTSTFKALKKDYEDYRMQGLMYCYMIRKQYHGELKLRKITQNNFEKLSVEGLVNNTTVYCIVDDEKDEDLIIPENYNPTKATFYMILRDWQKSKAKFDRDYPQSQVIPVTFNFTDKDFEWIEQWIKDKFEAIKAAEQLPDNELPLCSEKDRWKTEDVWAVKKRGRKSALRLLNSEQEALDYKAKHGGDFIEFRQGSDRKCADGYCGACQFCQYWIKNYKDKGETNDQE